MQNRNIVIFDTTLRDGEQSPGASMTGEQKVLIACQLEKLGVDVIEAGFPASSPGDFEAVQKVSRAVETPIVCAMARAKESDIDTTVAALQEAKRPRIHLGFGASDHHIVGKFKMSREQAMEHGAAMVRYARNRMDDVEYFLEDASRADPDYLCRVTEAIIRAGATVINVCDTVGYATPVEFGALVRTLMERVPNIDRVTVSVHCHDDLGMAVANSLAGIENGAQQIECTINGIGERAGNASLEEIVMAIKTRIDCFHCVTNLNTREIARTSHLVSEISGILVQPNKAVVGANAFSHSSGIHQAGMLKNSTTYQIMEPEEVGMNGNLILLSARSGRHALEYRLKALGYDFTPEQIEDTYRRFLTRADQEKYIDDRVLHDLASPFYNSGVALIL